MNVVRQRRPSLVRYSRTMNLCPRCNGNVGWRGGRENERAVLKYPPKKEVSEIRTQSNTDLIPDVGAVQRSRLTRSCRLSLDMKYEFECRL